MDSFDENVDHIHWLIQLKKSIPFSQLITRLIANEEFFFVGAARILRYLLGVA